MNYPIKYTATAVKEAMNRTVSTLLQRGVLTRDTVYLVMMNGGGWFASHFFDLLDEPDNEVYYLKAHSYHGTERGELSWDYLPDMQLAGRDVVLLDDICDSGKTAEAVYRYLMEDLQQSPRSVSLLTLLSRTSTILHCPMNHYACIVDPSQDFFVGCGLDNNGEGRMLPYVGIVQ